MMQQASSRPPLSISLFACAMLIGGGACAQDGAAAPGVPGWSLSGFGTLGVVHSSERDADYTASVMKASGAGATRPWSADVDSRFGIQLDARLGGRWSAVLQLISEQGLDNSYRPRVEWANLKYQATPDLALRLGRISLPMFLTADYRKIGYIYPWVRPPVEGYGAMPFTSSDGVDATWRWTAGGVRNSSQLFYGRASVPLAAPLHAWARGIVGIANTSDWGALSVRASAISGNVTTDIGDQLFDGFEAIGPAGLAISRRYEIDHKRVDVASIGVAWDPGRWFVMLETSRTHSASLLGATRSMYASAGLRVGAFTPYLNLSGVRAAVPTRDEGLPTAGLAPALARPAAQLNGGLNMLLATIPQQTTQAAGVRWDAARNIDLTLQYDRVTPHHGSRGTLIDTTPAFRSGRTAHVASVALDFVY